MERTTTIVAVDAAYFDCCCSNMGKTACLARNFDLSNVGAIFLSENDAGDVGDFGDDDGDCCERMERGGCCCQKNYLWPDEEDKATIVLHA